MYCGERGLVRSQWRGRKIFSERESFHFCGDGTAAVFLDLEAPVAHGLLNTNAGNCSPACFHRRMFIVLHFAPLHGRSPGFPIQPPRVFGRPQEASQTCASVDFQVV